MDDLKKKALKIAIRDILTANDRQEANARYLKWAVFHSEPAFQQAVKQKQSQLKEREE